MTTPKRKELGVWMSKQRLADHIKTDGMSDKKSKEIVDSVLEAIIDGLQLDTKE